MVEATEVLGASYSADMKSVSMPNRHHWHTEKEWSERFYI